MSLMLSLAASCVTVRSSLSVGHELAEATQAFLASLDSTQRKAALHELADPEAVDWHFVPGRYAGVEMGALDAGQKATQLAHAL